MSSPLFAKPVSIRSYSLPAPVTALRQIASWASLPSSSSLIRSPFPVHTKRAPVTIGEKPALGSPAIVLLPWSPLAVPSIFGRSRAGSL